MRCLPIAITILALLLAGCGKLSTTPPAPSASASPVTALTGAPAPAVTPEPNTAPPPSPSSPPPTTSMLTPGPTAVPSTQQVRSIVLTGHQGWVGRLAWSPDGKILASASGDYTAHDLTARLWKPDGTPLAVLSAHTAEVYALAWSPDGEMLATGGGDGTVRLWRPDGTLIKTLESVGTVFGLSWSPDGKVLVSGSSVGEGKNTVQFWTAGGELIRSRYTDQTGGKFYNVAWSPDGRFVVGGAIDYKLWRSDGSEVFHYTAGGTPAWALAWSPDSQRWVIGDENGNAYLFDTAGHELAQLHDPLGGITSLAWSPDGRYLAGGDGVSLWQADGAPLASLSGDSSSVTSLMWSPDGSLLAAGSSRNYGRAAAATNHAVRIWSAGRQLLATLTGHTDDVLSVALSPDGRILASGSKDKTIRLWQLPDFAR